MHVLTRLAAAASLALLPVAAPLPAHAASVCLQNNQLAFSPALTLLSNQSGNVTIGYQDTCADLPGLEAGHHNGQITVPYFGSCALAIIAEGGQSVVIGGTVYVLARDNLVKLEVLQPDNVCPISSAHGTGVVVTV